MFQRIWRYLNALINGKLDEWEDPEIILNQATKEMKENQIKNRELAVQAITQKNNLQAEVDKAERMVAELERRATVAVQAGNRELAKQFLKEKALHDQTLQSMLSSKDFGALQAPASQERFQRLNQPPLFLGLQIFFDRLRAGPGVDGASARSAVSLEVQQ